MALLCNSRCARHIVAVVHDAQVIFHAPTREKLRDKRCARRYRRAIFYVHCFVPDSLRFILRELRADASIGPCDGSNNRYNRMKRFLFQVYRKCATLMSHLFTEQILRARALAITATKDDSRRRRSIAT